MKAIARIGGAIALFLLIRPLTAQVPAPSLDSLARMRLSAMQRELRAIGEMKDARGRALQTVGSLMNSEDRKQPAWREVQDFELGIDATLDGLAEMLQTAMTVDINDSERPGVQLLAAAIRSDRLLEKTISTLIRLSEQQATSLALLTRTGKFAPLQRQIDETVRIAEDWRRQWINTIADEEDLQGRIAAP